MKKFLLSLLIVFAFIFSASAQKYYLRSNGKTTPIDPRLATTLSFKLPVFPDTATALTNAGLDSVGLIFKQAGTNNTWIRNPGHWLNIFDTAVFYFTNTPLTTGSVTLSYTSNDSVVISRLRPGTNISLTKNTDSSVTVNAFALGIDDVLGDDNTSVGKNLYMKDTLNHIWFSVTPSSHAIDIGDADQVFNHTLFELNDFNSGATLIAHNGFNLGLNGNGIFNNLVGQSAQSFSAVIALPNTGDGTDTLATMADVRAGGSVGTLEPKITASNTVKQYWNGYKNFVTLLSDSINEGSTNKFFTNARAIGSTLTGYTSGAGTISSGDNILTAIEKLNGNQVAGFTINQVLGFGDTSNGKTLSLHDTNGNPWFTVQPDARLIDVGDQNGVGNHTGFEINDPFGLITFQALSGFVLNLSSTGQSNLLIGQASQAIPDQLALPNTGNVGDTLATLFNVRSAISGAGAQPLITASNTIKQYWNGYKNFVSLNTDSITEGTTNKFFTNARTIASTLTGYTSGSGTISSSDNILQAIQKLNGNQAASVTGSGSFGQVAYWLNSTTQGSSSGFLYDTTKKSITVGLSNSNTGAKSFVAGESNTIDGSFGSQHNVAMGFSNTMNGLTGYSMVAGNSNYVHACNDCLVVGLNDTAYGLSSLTGTMIAGQQNFASSTGQQFLFGLGLHSNLPLQFLTGQYNDTTRGVAFGIGNGSSYNTRSNSFFVDFNGTIFTAPNTTANRPSSPTSGMLRFNSDSSGFEQYTGSAWQLLGGAGGGGTYTLPTATTSVLGGVKIDGTSVTIASGVISAHPVVGMAEFQGMTEVSTSNYTITSTDVNIEYGPTTAGTITFPTGVDGRTIWISNLPNSGTTAVSVNLYQGPSTFSTTLTTGHVLKAVYSSNDSHWHAFFF